MIDATAYNVSSRQVSRHSVLTLVIMKIFALLLASSLAEDSNLKSDFNTYFAHGLSAVNAVQSRKGTLLTSLRFESLFSLENYDVKMPRHSTTL